MNHVIFLWQSDSVSSPLQGSESQQQYPKVSETLSIRSDDRNFYTDPSEETYVAHLLENAANQSICRMSSLGSLTPTLSTLGFNHTPISVRPDLLKSESSATEMSSSQTRRKRQVYQYEQAIGLAMKFVPKNTANPSYCHFIARTIEIILNECPKDKQMLCGQKILTSALRIQMEMKNRSKILWQEKQQCNFHY